MGKMLATAEGIDHVRVFDWELKYEFGKVRNMIREALVPVKTSYIQRYPLTAIELVAEYGGQTYTEVVVVKLFSKDKWDPKTGRNIALGKAKANIARRIAKELRRSRIQEW